MISPSFVAFWGRVMNWFLVFVPQPMQLKSRWSFFWSSDGTSDNLPEQRHERKGDASASSGTRLIRGGFSVRQFCSNELSFSIQIPWG